MNNEPVAWMYAVNGIWTAFSDELPPDDAYDKGTLTPLYTHPVKEEDEQNWKEMYWQMHELNHKHWSELKAHPVKELTDEEIEKLYDELHYLNECEEWVLDYQKFARAILRKAQEK